MQDYVLPLHFVWKDYAVLVVPGDSRPMTLVARRCETEMRPHLPRAPEPIRTVDRRAERECRDRTDAWNSQQPTADLFRAHDIEDLFGKAAPA